ncbi:MAG: hypothetical protein CMO77_09295 [Verrucomicrobiales bacterium]|nr:hypothetical protein [Verrucomicrobiales bacterium]
MLKLVFNLVLRILDFFLPKKNMVCFYITPRTFWDANQQILYAKLKGRHKVIVVDGNYIGGTRFLNTIMSIWNLSRSKIVIFDHSIPFGLIASNHVMVNVWHGSPIKNIRFLCNNRFDEKFLLEQSKRTHYLASASNYDALLMSSALNVPYFNVTKFGLPRNDYLTCTKNELIDLDLYDEVQVVESKTKKYSKVALFAPTYRGDSHTKNDPAEFTEKQLLILEKYLIRTNTLLFVRLHKFSSINRNNGILNISNVIDASDYKNPMILLRYTDLLITDYSSIWIDFLLLKKPIIIYTPDIDVYTQNHGFIFDFEESIPCSPLTSFDSLIDNLDVALNSKVVSERQNYFYERYHASKSHSSSDELIELILR